MPTRTARSGTCACATERATGESTPLLANTTSRLHNGHLPPANPPLAARPNPCGQWRPAHRAAYPESQRRNAGQRGRGWRSSAGPGRAHLRGIFITDAPTVRDILAHRGEPIAPPRIAPARGPPLWAAADAERRSDPRSGVPAHPAYAFDQRLTWQPRPPPLVSARGAGRLAPTAAMPRGPAHAGPRESPAHGATTAPRRRPTTPSHRQPGRVNP